MTVDFTQLPHKGIQNLAPYQPGKPIVEVAREFGITDIIKLASNENACGCSDGVIKILQTMTRDKLAPYPSALNHPLYDKLAEKLQVNRNQLIITNGSDAIFQFLLMAFALHTGKHLLTHDYSFITYQILAEALGVPVVKTRLNPDWQVDVDELIKHCNAETGLIMLANPNNPTGVLTGSDDLERLLKKIPESTILVIDEAYFEYAQSSYTTNSIDWLSQYRNLIITRTFSKAYGLAGLRLGYGISNPDIIAMLQKVQLPFAVNQIALDAGVAALEDQNFLEKTLGINHAGMQQMLQGLESLQVKALPSPAGNFVTIDCQKNGMEVYQKLLEKGIIVRPLHPYNMQNYIRVTIGTVEENDRFLDTLKQINKE